MAWRTAIALDEYRAAVNARYPGRSKVSDGTIGDNAHAGQGSDSDHNPWIMRDGVGVVRAFDLTHDPAHGVDCSHLSDLLFEMGKAGDPRLRNGGYLIFDDWITNPDWSSWRRYGGSNPHTSHMHISFSTDAFDHRGDWSAAFPTTTPEVPGMSDQQLIPSLADPRKKFSATQFLQFADLHSLRAREAAEQAVKLLGTLAASVEDLRQRLDAFAQQQPPSAGR